MPRAALPSFALAAAATAAAATGPACEREQPAPTLAGPAYTPANADLLKALAADCEIKPGPDGNEVRDCRGRQSKVRIELDRERRIRVLDMTVLASTGVWEAWTLYENVLPALVGQAVTDTVRKKLRGDPAEAVTAGARVTTVIDGDRYSVKLTWGR
ncbi:MAG TPA: hypothetical protein VNO30_26630 [Kofleriaceae bacterium]|nr:hypothetical protein [Kofleriaceae bacterium]